MKLHWLPDLRFWPHLSLFKGSCRTWELTVYQQNHDNGTIRSKVSHTITFVCMFDNDMVVIRYQKSEIRNLFIQPIYKLHWVFFNIYLQTYGSERYLLRQLTLPLVQIPPQLWKNDTKYHILYQNNNMLLHKKKQINNKNN